MSQQQPKDEPGSDPSSAKGSGQQPQQSEPEGHAGQGADSIMKELREWESRRAHHSGGTRRTGPN